MKNNYQIPELGENKVLLISTRKKAGYGAITTASVCVIEHYNGYAMESHIMFQDFFETVNTLKAKRVTDKVIKECHETALLRLETIKRAAIEHYSKGE